MSLRCGLCVVHHMQGAECATGPCLQVYMVCVWSVRGPSKAHPATGFTQTLFAVSGGLASALNCVPLWFNDRVC